MAPLTRSRANSRAKKSQENAETEASNALLEGDVEVEGEGKEETLKDTTTTLNPEPEADSETPKRQRLAVRTREDESTGHGRKTHIEVEISNTSTSKPQTSRRSSVRNLQDIEGVSEFEPMSASKQLEDEADHRLSSQPAIPEATTPMPKPVAKGKHLVFGDDADVEKFVAAAATIEPKKNINDKGDEADSNSDDDDDAPEAVSTQAAAKQVLQATQAATEAADKQAASLKRKRQEKDSLYKQQAERRKRARATVELHQRKRTSTKRTGTGSGNEDDGVAEVEEAVTTGRRRAQKFHLPTALPAEFLADSSSDEDEDAESALKKQQKKAAALVSKPQKINFEALASGGSSKNPRDKTVGATRYRVLAEQGDPLVLAPRSHRDARVSKESLLKRRRVTAAAAGVVAGKRTGGGGRFFVRK